LKRKTGFFNLIVSMGQKKDSWAGVSFLIIWYLTGNILKSQENNSNKYFCEKINNSDLT